MIDQYEIEIQRPIRSRRGDTKLIVVAWDDQGKEFFRDQVNLNEERMRSRVAQRIASLTGDDADRIAGRLLDKLGQLPPPTPIATSGTTTDFPYEATPGGLLWNKETPEGVTPDWVSMYSRPFASSAAAPYTPSVIESSGEGGPPAVSL